MLSHLSAGQLWGLLPARRSQAEISAPRGARARRPGIRCHESGLAPDEVADVDGIPVTSVFRTMLDLAAILDERGLERAWNEMEVRGLTDRLSMAELLRRHPGRRGIAKLRRLAGEGREGGGITRNAFEEAFVAFLDRHRLPRGRMNADLALRGRFFEVDCLWDDRRLVAELDGAAAHGTRRAFQRDRERDRILLAEGWRVARITWDQLRDEPDAIAADLRQTLGITAAQA